MRQMSILSVHNTTMADYGLYKCVALNELGQDDTSVNLVATSKYISVIMCSYILCYYAMLCNCLLCYSMLLLSMKLTTNSCKVNKRILFYLIFLVSSGLCICNLVAFSLSRLLVPQQRNGRSHYPPYHFCLFVSLSVCLSLSLSLSLSLLDQLVQGV